jgi:hypothetical protein
MRDALHQALNVETRGFRRGDAASTPGLETGVSGDPRAAENSSRCLHTHTPPATGGPHASRMSAWCVWHAWSLGWQLRQELLQVRRRLLVILPAEAVRVSTTGHQGSQYLMQGC